MTQPKHTPGPWVVETGSTGTWGLVEGSETGFVFTAYDPMGNDGEAKANARLIAQAPRMAALLRRICDDQSWRTVDNTIWPELTEILEDIEQ